MGGKIEAGMEPRSGKVRLKLQAIAWSRRAM